MITIKKDSKNAKLLKNARVFLEKTGQGIKMAADTGYKTGYFMAKHPEIEVAGKQIRKNYKAGLIAALALLFGLAAILMIKKD